MTSKLEELMQLHSRHKEAKESQLDQNQIQELRLFESRLKKNKQSLIGWQIGNILVINEGLSDKRAAKNQRHWICLCACGIQFNQIAKKIPTTANQIVHWLGGSKSYVTACQKCRLVDCVVCGKKFEKKRREKHCGSLACKRELNRIACKRYWDNLPSAVIAEKNRKQREIYANDPEFRARRISAALNSREKKKNKEHLNSAELKKEKKRLQEREKYINDPEFRARKIFNQKKYLKRKKELGRGVD